MPSNKTFTTIILCFAFVVSIWLIFRKTPIDSQLLQKQNGISVETYKNTAGTNDDWKKMLTNLGGDDSKTNDLTKKSENTPEDTTLTAQLAKDVFSTYLISTKTGEPFSSDTANAIATNVLASPNYSKDGGAVYVASNLHIGDGTSATAINYKLRFNEILLTRLSQIQGNDPMAILNTSLTTNNDDLLKKIEIVTKAIKGFMNDMLALTVPSNATKVHLGVLNAASNMLSDIEGIQLVNVDPIKGLQAIGRYYSDLDVFIASLKDINSYFEEN